MDMRMSENLNCLRKAEKALRDAKILVDYLSLVIEEERNSGSPENTALSPVPKIEDDSYDWYERHREKCMQVEKNVYDLVFIGDSITHFWESPNGPETWRKYYGKRNVLNIGFGWDRTQNVLWRLENGEFVNQKPKLVVLNIGTNNLTGNRVRGNTPDEIAEGIEAICAFIHWHSPATKILLMDIFPRGTRTDDLFQKITATNAILNGKMADRPNIAMMDIGAKLLCGKGDVNRDLLPDGTHPNEKGYEVWAEAIEPFVKRILKD